MSITWKIINVLLVWVPKMLLWRLTCEVGMTFLMETPNIEDSIVNCVALTFVLRIDEMFFELMSEAIKMMLEAHEELKFYDLSAESLDEDSIMQRFGWGQALRKWKLMDCFSCLPKYLTVVMIMTIAFMFLYYVQRCEYVGGGHWHSKPMYMPLSVKFSPWCAFFPFFFSTPSETEPFWTQPDPIA